MFSPWQLQVCVAVSGGGIVCTPLCTCVFLIFTKHGLDSDAKLCYSVGYWTTLYKAWPATGIKPLYVACPAAARHEVLWFCRLLQSCLASCQSQNSYREDA